METRTKGWTNEAFHRQKGLSIDHGFHDFPAGRRSGSERFCFVFDGELSNESLLRRRVEESCFFFFFFKGEECEKRWIDDLSFQTMPRWWKVLLARWIWTKRNVFLSYENYRELTKESFLSLWVENSFVTWTCRLRNWIYLNRFSI